MALSKFIIQAPKRKKPIHLSRFLQTVWLGNSAAVQDVVAQDPTARAPFLEEIDTGTGMNALHLAVGRNNLEITKLLVEAGVAFIPDAYGRMPSVIAGGDGSLGGTRGLHLRGRDPCLGGPGARGRVNGLPLRNPAFLKVKHALFPAQKNISTIQSTPILMKP